MYTLCDGLAYNPVIKEITIEYCELDSTFCIDLTHLIPTLPQLKELDVTGNKLNSTNPTQKEILKQAAK